MDAVPYNKDECPQAFRFACTHQNARHIFTQWADRLARRNCALFATSKNEVDFSTERATDTFITDFAYNVPSGHRVYKS